MRVAKMLATVLAASTLAVAAPVMAAPDYPKQPIRLIVGFTAGSTIDLVARIIGDGLAKRMNTSFVVENRTGANGMIAARTVAQAAPDGYTLLVSNSSSITVNPLLFKDLGYHPLKDFEPISTVVSVPFVLSVNPDNPRTSDIKTVAGLVDLAKKNPGGVMYGSAGNGNLMHLAGAQLATMSNTQMVHVPYRGAASMQVGLMGREIDFGFDTLSGAPLLESGKLRAIAVSTKERWRDLPDVPSVAEEGYPEFDISFWVGTFAPAGTPPEIVELLNKEIAAVVQEEETKKRLMPQGNILTQSPSEFIKKIETELEQNGQLIKSANISVDQ